MASVGQRFRKGDTVLCYGKLTRSGRTQTLLAPVAARADVFDRSAFVARASRRDLANTCIRRAGLGAAGLRDTPAGAAAYRLPPAEPELRYAHRHFPRSI